MPADCTNPGNLRDCPWFAMRPGTKTEFEGRYYPDGERVNYSVPPHDKSGAGFWKPRERAEGVAGAAHVVALHIAEGNTLEQLISIWAPPTDNNDTATYIRNVAEWAAIPDAATPLWNFST